MKALFAIFIALVGPTASAQSYYFDNPIMPPGSDLVAIEAEEIFIPDGFDDNDQVVAVIDGYLPDSCYRVTHNETIVDPATGAIKIVQFARRFNAICLPVRVPYWNEVNLGVLPTGSFDVTTEGAPAETLYIAEATNAGPDDHMYAPVDSARVEANFATNQYTAVVQGRFTNSCMAWDEVRLLTTGKTIEILPVVKWEERDDCRAIEVPFVWTEVLPENMDPRRYLLHVRSMNGKAINHMFTVIAPE